MYPLTRAGSLMIAARPGLQRSHATRSPPWEEMKASAIARKRKQRTATARSRLIGVFMIREMKSGRQKSSGVRETKRGFERMRDRFENGDWPRSRLAQKQA